MKIITLLYYCLLGEKMIWPFDFTETLSLGTLLATLILAVGTLILALETKRMRLAQTEPEVFIHFQPKKDDLKTIDLVIGNSGNGTAFNIEFEIYPDFEYKKGKLLSKLSFMQEGIPFLAPKQTLKSYLLWLEEVNSLSFDDLAKPFQIEINYQNISGKKIKRLYPMDLSPLASLTYRKLPSIHKNIDKIEEHQKNISDRLNELIQVLNNE